jgi:hypothetical protein
MPAQSRSDYSSVLCSRIFSERYFPLLRLTGYYALRGFCYSTISDAIRLIRVVDKFSGPPKVLLP